MRISFLSQSWTGFSIQSIRKNFFDSLTFQQKRIAAIVAIVLSGLVACYLLCRHCIFKDKEIDVASADANQRRILEGLLPDFLSEQETNLQLFSSDLTLLQDSLDRHIQQENDLNDLTQHTEKELDQLLDNANPHLFQRELESAETLHNRIEEEFHLYKSYLKDQFESQQSVKDLRKLLTSKMQDFHLLKAKVENYHKQQEDLIQRVCAQKRKLVDAAYHQKVKTIHDQEAQQTEVANRGIVKQLQEDYQDFSKRLQTLTDFLDQYPSRCPDLLHLSSDKKELDVLSKTVSRSITLTKRYIHEAELKKIEINARLNIHQDKQSQAMQAFQSEWAIKIVEFEQLKVKAVNQEKEQISFLDRLVEQEKKLIDDQQAQTMQQHVQKQRQVLQNTQNELDVIVHQSKRDQAALVRQINNMHP